MTEPVEYTFDASQWIEWEYDRPEGAITVFAPTRTEAVRCMAEHGFHNIDPEVLIKRDRFLSNVLQKAAIE